MEINIFPTWLLNMLHVPSAAQHDLALFVSAVLAALLTPVARRLPHICLAQTLFDIPCPGCGILHSASAVLHMNILAAWQANPAGVGVALVLLFQVVARPLALAMPGVRSHVALVSKVLSGAATVALFLVWILRLVRGGLNAGNQLP